MCNCNLTPAQPCNVPTYTPCVGCATTLNADCIIYNKTKLSYEPSTVMDNSGRSLSTLLKNLETRETYVETEFHNLGDGNFTLDANSHNKLITLVDNEGVTGYNSVIQLPTNSEAYIGKTYTFINKTTTASGTWSFNVPLVTDYDPLTTQTAYNSIVLSGTKVLKIAFVLNTPTSYGWVIIQN